MKNKKLYISLCLIGLFIINTILVVTKAYQNLDMDVHALIIRYHSEITTKIMKVFTFCGSTIFIILLAIILFILFFILKKKNTAYSVMACIVTSTLINNAIKLIIQRPRSSYMPEGLESSFSYPSGHTMASVTIYGFLLYLLVKSNIAKKYKILYGILLVLLMILVGISRIYLGAHYFSDVLGGILLSSALILIFAHLNDQKKWI